MPVYLSPGVFPREIDLSVIPTAVGPLRPAFIGTAKKGPMNAPTYVTTSQQFIDTFGTPFPESFMGYAVLAYMEEGNQAYILRAGVECEEGQVEELADICIDTSGANGHGWGRIPVFTGIDYGKIRLRSVSTTEPLAFHSAAITDIYFSDMDVTVPTAATLSFVGGGLSDAYAGAIDDSYLLLITSAPTTGAMIAGATYEVIRNSDGVIIASGMLSESVVGQSDPITLVDGMICSIIVTSGELDVQDSFSFNARPDNRSFGFAVDLSQSPTVNIHSFNDGESFTDADTFVTRFNAIIGGSEDYKAVHEDEIIYIRSDVAGVNIQMQHSEAWALEVGRSLYAYDIPRSFLISTDAGPFNITANNNRIKMTVVDGEPVQATTDLEFSIPIGLNLTTAQVAAGIQPGGIKNGSRFFNAYPLEISTGVYYVVIETAVDHCYGVLKLQANLSNVRTLRFAEELEIQYPYYRNFRTYGDSRAMLPTTGVITPSVPLSCEIDPLSDDCALDSAYFAGIVGWFVAKSPGTWIDSYTLDLTQRLTGTTSGGSVQQAGHFDITLRDLSGVTVDRVEDVTFDPRDSRFVGNVINAGSTLGGFNGNAFIQWESRPSFLANDPLDPTTFVVRVPSPVNRGAFIDAANGIPTDPAYSSELDRVFIGNPAKESGIYAFQNPEVFDINLLLVPGASSGAVIGQMLQFCEARGDVLSIIDPPFGLRPQQVVDWHNGMLFADLQNSINSSYGALYWSWLRIFDQYNGGDIYIPPSGHVSSVFARTARVAEQWFAPAGLNRGHLLTPTAVEFNPTMGERDLLYGSGNAVNPIVNFVQDGITIWGQRTLQRRQSALDRVNVRMLLIYIKKNLSRALRQFIFEPNDRILWAQVRSVVNPFLADIQARRGLQAFKVVCDETNNTPERIDRNELWISVFLKPTRAVEFIVLNLVILRTEASFSSEEVLQAGGVVTQQPASV
jgi:hypothetical protein